MKNLIKKNQLMITALAIMIAIAGYLQFAGDNLEEEYVTVNDGTVSEVDSDGVITENYTAEGLAEGLEGITDLTGEDMQAADLLDLDITSLDSDMDVIAEDYLDVGMELTDAGTAEAGTVTDNLLTEATPAEGEIPGEAVFTASDGVLLLSEAKLLKEQTRAKNKETLLEIINSTGLTDAQKQVAVSSMIQMTDFAEKETAAEILLEAKGFADVVVSISSSGVDVVVNSLDLTDVQRAQIEDIVTRKTNVAAENIVISTVTQ